MPKITFDQENKLERGKEYTKLRLEQDEKARVVCLGDPEFAWVHTLRAPVIDEDGNAETFIDERSKKEQFKLGYISEPQCLGDYDTIAERGLDEKNCPVCALASSGVTTKPYRRFAIHVFKYSTKPNSFNVQNPFNGHIAVWRFRDGVFGQLSDLQAEWKVPLSQIDLKLGPCEVVQFQKYKITNASDCEWQQDDTKVNRKAFVLESLEENGVEDLSALCGRKTELHWIERDLEEVKERWATAKGETSTPAPKAPVSAPAMDSSLLDTKASSSEEEKPVKKVKTFTELLQNAKNDDDEDDD